MVGKWYRKILNLKLTVGIWKISVVVNYTVSHDESEFLRVYLLKCKHFLSFSFIQAFSRWGLETPLLAYQVKYFPDFNYLSDHYFLNK
jgi:hypothetical protein